MSDPMPDKFSISFKKSQIKADTAVVFVYDKNILSAEASALDKKAGGLLSQALQTRDTFKGAHGDALSVFLPAGAGYKQVLMIGLGDSKKLDALAYEHAGGKTLPALKSMSATDVAILFDTTGAQAVKTDMAAAYASGLTLRHYSFDKYKQGKEKKKSGDGVKKKALSHIIIQTSNPSAAEKAYTTYDALATGVLLARDLVNEAPNVLYPESYAAIIQKELKPLGVQVEIFDEKKMQKLGFGAHLAVGMGSARPPRVVIMRWNGLGGGKKRKGGPLAFVGKGVTFDTGGISIKPAAGMEEMKMDMGGSAAVVGLIKALALRKAKTDVVGIVGLAENMPSDRAYRPGDIITSLSGKTIEILNTDAEGRLVLADALTYVQQTYKPGMIIDLATLTGAIMVALGLEYAGAFVNDDTLWSKLEQASKRTGEKLWRMPLDEAYREEMKNTVSDLKNLGNLGRYGGACSAAGFLEHFIESGTAWAHLDIAGTAWWKSDKAVVPKGGSGFGVRLLHALVHDNYEA